MNPRPKKEHNPDLYEAILHLHSPEECMRFFEDLCTVSEMFAMEQRFQVARALHNGRIYSDILAETGASSATISRVNRSLQYGQGAYEMLFRRMAEEEQAEKTGEAET